MHVRQVLTLLLSSGNGAHTADADLLASHTAEPITLLMALFATLQMLKAAAAVRRSRCLSTTEQQQLVDPPVKSHDCAHA